jgi:hypothetical protein
LLDFFRDNDVFKKSAERIVIAGGLKFLFPIFLGSRIPKPAAHESKTAKAKREWLNDIKAQTVRIFYALAFQLDELSPDEAKPRFIAKFIEGDQKSCDRLVELLLEYDDRVRKAEYNFYKSDVEEDFNEEEAGLAAFDAKLKAGGDILHRLAAVTAYVCANSKRCHERVLSQLQLQQSGISLVKGSLKEFCSSLQNGGRQKQFIEDLFTLI